MSWVSFIALASLGHGFWVRECSSGLNPSILRTIRLVRLLNSIPSPPLRELLAIISAPQHLTATAALTFVFFLVLYSCTLLGSAYFGGKLERCQQCTPLPRPLQLPLPYGGIDVDSTGFSLGIAYEPLMTSGYSEALSLCECEPTLRVCLLTVSSSNCSFHTSLYIDM